jgi:4-hydroxybutyrate CoA-transferase
VVAEVNDKMPWTYGQDPLHISKLDHIIEVSYPIPELPAEPVLDVHKKIGRYVADLVEDGSTLQIGVGAVPDVILSFLSGRKELGVHTEILQGVITNQHKRLNREKSVATMLDGSQRLFQFAHKNPLIEIYPIEYTNDPYIISQNDKVVAINSALEIDLTGQVNCETIDGQLYGGVGGVLDFGLGANRSSGGKNILAFPSTAKGGQVSRVVPTLKPGTVVTIPRTQVDYVVTEHGVSQLKGKTLHQRTKLLIDLAAPAFRDELWNQARSLKLT